MPKPPSLVRTFAFESNTGRRFNYRNVPPALVIGVLFGDMSTAEQRLLLEELQALHEQREESV